MTNKNREALAQLYDRMDTGRIEAQIASGRLTSAALNVAKQELQCRKQETSITEPPTTPPKLSPKLIVVAMLVQAVIVIAATILLHAENTLLVVTAEAAVLAGLTAKAFPKLGKILGTILMVLPFGVIAVAWYQGILAWGAHGSGMGYVVNIVIYGFLAIGSAISWIIGHSMLEAARFTGTWEEFFRWLEEKRKDMLKRDKR